jgi:hypothetical protein
MTIIAYVAANECRRLRGTQASVKHIYSSCVVLTMVAAESSELITSLSRKIGQRQMSFKLSSSLSRFKKGEAGGDSDGKTRVLAVNRYWIKRHCSCQSCSLLWMILLFLFLVLARMRVDSFAQVSSPSAHPTQRQSATRPSRPTVKCHFVHRVVSRPLHLCAQ